MSQAENSAIMFYLYLPTIGGQLKIEHIPDNFRQTEIN